MKFRHVIRPIPAKGIYDNAVVVDNYLSYVEVDEGAAPSDAIYVCVQDTAKSKADQFTVVKDQTDGVLTSKHTFAGWALPAAAK